MSQSSPKVSRRSVLGAAAAGAAGLLLVACGQVPATPGQTGPAPSTPGGQAGPPPAGGTATSPGTASAEKTLTVAVEADASSLKPDTWGPRLNGLATRALYDNLVHYHTKVGPDGLHYYDDEKWDPRLAEEVTVSDDRRTITWKIRQGPTFENGKPIDAQAILKSFQWYWDRGAVGKGQMEVDGIASRDALTAPDERTLVMNLEFPAPWGAIANFIHLLAVIDVDEVMKHATPEDPFGEKWLERNTVASGPYRIEQWRSGESMILVAREDYWAGKPPIDRIIFRVIPDASVRFSILKTGDVDLVTLLDFKDYAALRDDPNIVVESWTSNNWSYLGLNWNRPEFQDIDVRKAIAYAIPYQEIIDTVYFGFATRNKTPFGALAVGGDPSLWPYDFDLEKAKEHLAKSQYPNGFSVPMQVVNSDVNEEKAAVLIADSLAKIGIAVEIQKVTPPQKSEAQIARNLTMAISGFYAFIPDAGYLAHWAHYPDSYANFFGYNNQQVEAIGREMMYLEPRDPKRLALLADYQKAMAEDVYGAFLYSANAVYPHRKSVTGFAYYPDGYPRWDRLTIE